MSATDIIKELPRLTEAERRLIADRLRELANQAGEDRVREPAAPYRMVDLHARGISETQADNLRARLKTFAEDWDRPEASIYDEHPPR